MRSGVNWTRLNDPPRTSARVLIVSVLARPGTPSSRMWPPAQQADEDALEHRVLADDHAADLEQDGFGDGARVVVVGDGAQVAAGLGRVGLGHRILVFKGSRRDGALG